MNVVLWIVASLLAAAFAAAGVLKLTRSREQLVSTGLGWAGDFPPGVVKLIGALELLAAVGLILPAALDIAPVLVPLAALGLVLIMIGAAVTHGRRGEFSYIAFNAVLLILAGIVVWGRFGPYAF